MATDLIQRLPGTRPGRGRRNLVLVAAWLSLSAIAGLYVLGAALVAPALLVVYVLCSVILAIGFDWWGVRSKTAGTAASRIPGLYDGDRRAGVAAVAYCLAIFFLATSLVNPASVSTASNVTDEVVTTTDVAIEDGKNSSAPTAASNGTRVQSIGAADEGGTNRRPAVSAATTTTSATWVA